MASSQKTRDRRRLFLREKGKCFYCRVSMTMRPGLGTTCTRDHIIPASKGGDDSMKNMVAACALCNHTRGDMDAGDFLVIVTREGRDGVIRLARSKGGTPAKTQAFEIEMTMARMEREIRNEVRRFADARFPARKDILYAAQFVKGDAATFALADIWPKGDCSIH